MAWSSSRFGGPRPTAAEAPAPLPRGVCAESRAQARRHGARYREQWQVARCRDRWACGRRTCGREGTTKPPGRRTRRDSAPTREKR
ncbi:hypothetical protein EBR04_07245, partial [bacterium]|nr:hypothetical protein [bacterium]